MYMIDCGNCLQIFPLGFAHFVVHIFISLIHVIIHRLKPLKNPFLKAFPEDWLPVYSQAVDNF